MIINNNSKYIIVAFIRLDVVCLFIMYLMYLMTYINNFQMSEQFSASKRT